MRAFFGWTVVAALLLVPFGYHGLGILAFYDRPLSTELAHEALIARLQQAAASRHELDFSDTTVLRRKKEVIFYGHARVRLADRLRFAIPLVEDYNFQYVAIVTRTCQESQSECYRASELEITGTKLAAPMI